MDDGVCDPGVDDRQLHADADAQLPLAQDLRPARRGGHQAPSVVSRAGSLVHRVAPMDAGRSEAGEDRGGPPGDHPPQRRSRRHARRRRRGHHFLAGRRRRPPRARGSGDPVKSGQTLVEIDREKLQYTLDEQKAAHARALTKYGASESGNCRRSRRPPTSARRPPNWGRRNRVENAPASCTSERSSPNRRSTMRRRRCD